MNVKNNNLNKKPLCGIPRSELPLLLNSLPRYRSNQIFKWIYSGVSSFGDMRNLPLDLREELDEHYCIRTSSIKGSHTDTDETVKLEIMTHDNVIIEAVLLTDGQGRKTACLSTQAGCPAQCVFCKTGSLGFLRNLSASEIVEQFLYLRETSASVGNAFAGNASVGNAVTGNDSVGKPKSEHMNHFQNSINFENGFRKTSQSAGFSSKSKVTFPKTEVFEKSHIISNIVFMGMGEPLLNIENVKNAIAVLCDSYGINFSTRRITISTCGIKNGIIDLADNVPGVRLARSLTTADQSLRNRLMPIGKKENLSGIKDALVYFQHAGGGRVTLEAVLFDGINTRKEDAKAIAEFADGLDTVVNIIPWNPITPLPDFTPSLRTPSRQTIDTFIGYLEDQGMNVTCRYRKGRSISGACGQLGFINAETNS